ncbi:hypothetical protein IE4872_PC00456 (plasmid) [Rhizobium gallicum]|uniref:Uncharacterized protein n=1 Tax=Rhizobium gallicum TaxID=56730 RepID=A0A1L5NRE0_9HYPH|nr:hypothetical protein IE4872_PC00456 [Rhizobium gallicum]
MVYFTQAWRNFLRTAAHLGGTTAVFREIGEPCHLCGHAHKERWCPLRDKLALQKVGEKQI